MGKQGTVVAAQDQALSTKLQQERGTERRNRK